MPRSTKLEAGASLRGAPARNLRSQVFRFVLRQSANGATNEEISDSTGIKLQTVCARRNELGKKYVLVDSGRRRATSSGRSAIVWVVPERVREAATKRGM